LLHQTDRHPILGRCLQVIPPKTEVTMRKPTLLVIATLASGLLVAASAGAQDTTVSKGDVARPATLASLVAAINYTATTVETLKGRAIIKSGDVSLANARVLTAEKGDDVLNADLERHAAEIAQLRAILAKQPELTALLSNQTPKLTTNDVIAVDAQADGKLVIFYRTKDGSLR
jgi:hypothetical protein